jgi:uroporphyrinogen-III synthase
MAKKKVKSILISQPKPVDENSPYYKLRDKWNLTLEFRKLISIEGVTTNEFRKQGVNPLDYSAIVFTSKYAIDHFFRILKDLKMEMPPDTKFFCVSEATSKYLQKYIVIRKRKLYVGERTSKDLIDIVKKHAKDKFLFPCSQIHTQHLTDWMAENKFTYRNVVIYNTVATDLSDIKELNFDMICFYSPSGIEALTDNFPNWKQGDTAIAVFGPTTAQAAVEAGFRVDIEAPTPSQPSMMAAIEDYLKESNKR